MSTARQWSDSFTFLPQGALVQEFRIAGRNIVLGFESEATYRSEHSPYFGETIGRVANRVSNARIENLNGRSYALRQNNGPNSLHGGVEGWGKKTFEGPTPVNRNGRESVMFRYVSPDGDQGYPGTVELKVWYIAGHNREDGVEKTSLEVEYEAKLIGDEVDATVVSVTHHSHFNISDRPTIEGTKVILHSNLHQPVDDTGIPTGAIEPYPGISANEEFTLGATEPDVDHCFIVDTEPAGVPLDTRSRPMRKLAELRHPDSKMHLEALSTEPAFQFYTGKFINVPAIDGRPAMGPRSGLCIEACRYVNAVNNQEWQSMVLLKKGETYGSRTIYRAWVE